MSLFRSSEPRPPTQKIENVLGPSASFHGRLKAEGGIRVDGAFEGALESDSNVIIGESANVVADVAGFHITVAGRVIGDITAVGRLEILATGYIRGDVRAASLLIEEGGTFHGRSLTDADEGTPIPEERASVVQRDSDKSEESMPENGSDTDNTDDSDEQ